MLSEKDICDRLKSEKDLTEEEIDALYEKSDFNVYKLERCLGKTREELLDILEKDFYADIY